MPIESPLDLLTEESRRDVERRLGPISQLAAQEYAKEAHGTLGARLVRYAKGEVPGTVPQHMRELIGEKLPRMMTEPGYIEAHPEDALEIAGLAVTGGVAGGLPKGAVGAGMTRRVGKSAGRTEQAAQQAALKTVKDPTPSTVPSKALDTPSKVIESMQVPPVEPSKFKSMVAEFGLASPETIFKLDKGGAGSQIYRVADRTDQAMNRFLVGEMNKFQAATGKIKKGSEGSARVARALDGKLDAGQLGTQEKELYEFLRKKFDFLYNEYARRLASSDEMYGRLAHAASAREKPKARLADMPAAQQNKVVGELNKLQGILKGRKYSELKGPEKQAYDRIRARVRKTREDAWVENLSPDDRQAYFMMQRKIKNYLPHMFDRDELVASFRDELVRMEQRLRLATKDPEKNKLKRRIKKLNENIYQIEGGGLVKYKDLPKEFRFKYFQARKGKEGYEFDAVKAYETYLHGFAKKFFGDPALKSMSELFKQVDPALKPYTRKFIESWAGLDPKTGAQKLAGTIAGMQWAFKLGMNPRSAIVNFTQRLNTIAAVGEKWSIKGYAYGWTDEGKRLFKSTGVGLEVPTVLMEGYVPANVEKLRQVLGYMFTKAELGNRKHAVLSGYLKAKAQGLSEQKALQAGVDLAHQTQFRYGRVGMPMPLRTPIGRLAFQFWSYPIKQMEFLVGLAKNDPAKLVKLLAYAEGGNELVMKDFLAVDLSNALGFGFNYGEFLKSLQDATQGDLRRAYRHMKLGFTGGGLLPTTFGPTLDSMIDFYEAVEEGQGVESAARAVMPVQFNKLIKAWKAVREGSPGQYPMYSKTGRLKFSLTGPELFVETFGPKSLEAKEAQKRWEERREAGREYDQIQREILTAFAKGKDEKAVKLIEKYPLARPSIEAVMNAKFAHEVEAETRDLMKRGKREQYIRLYK